jgi:hypothetical protein
MELNFTLRPGVDPLDRGELEDGVIEALGNGADCIGGGGMMDGSESDFQIEVDGLDVDDVIERCKAVFAAISFTLPTVVELAVEDRVVTLPTAVTEA